MKKILLFLALFSLSAFCGFLAKNALSASVTVSEGVGLANPQAESRAPSGGSGSGGSGASSAVQELDFESLDPDRFSARFLSAHPLAYARGLKVLEERITEETLVHLFGESPEDALSFLTENLEEEFYQKVLKRFTALDPGLVYRWITANPPPIEPAELDGLKVEILVVLAGVDPLTAATFSNELNDSDLSKSVILSAAETLGGRDSAAAFDWLETLSRNPEIPPSTVTSSYRLILSEYAKENPYQAAELVGGLESVQLQRLLAGDVADGLAAVDINSAFDWLGKLPDRAAQASGWSDLLESANTEQQQLVLAQIFSQPELFTGDSILQTNLIHELSEHSVEGLVAQFPSAFSEENQSVAARVVVAQWLKNGDLDQAVEWTQSQTTGQAREEAAAVIAENYAFSQQDALTGLQWANTIETPEARLRVYESIASRSDVSALSGLINELPRLGLNEAEAIEVRGIIEARVTAEGVGPIAIPGS